MTLGEGWSMTLHQSAKLARVSSWVKDDQRDYTKAPHLNDV